MDHDRHGSEVTEGLLARVSHSTWSRDGDLTTRHHNSVCCSVPQTQCVTPLIQATSTWALLTLSWSALGVIYGDILTSPLYVMSGVFESKHGIKPTHEEVIGAHAISKCCVIVHLPSLGVTSLVIWTIAALVVVKYSLVVLYADDHGNGMHVCMQVQSHPGTLLRGDVCPVFPAAASHQLAV